MPSLYSDYDIDREALLEQMGRPRQPREQGGVTGPLPGGVVAAPPLAAPPPPKEKKGPYQSENRSVSGYLQEAMGAYRPELIKISDEAGRKKAAEDYIRSLLPELEARGAKVGDIKGEKLQLDGKWYDLLRDIEGEAGVQFIEPSVDAQGNDIMGASPLIGGTSQIPLQGSDLFKILMERAMQAAGMNDRDAIMSQLGGQ